MTADPQTDSSEMQQSPDYVRISLAAAMTLRYSNALFHRNAKLYCVNILLTYSDGCSANCAYCGLARKRPGNYAKKSFIRVKWPTYETDDVLDRVEKYQEQVRRVCISMVTHRRAIEDVVDILRRARQRISLPLSVLVTPTIMDREDFERLKEAGADKVGIAVDAATDEIFDRLRGKGAEGPHRWDDYWTKIETAMAVFGSENVGVHLMVGLGETEREMMSAIQRMRSLGGSTHLFSFFPEAESRLGEHAQPPIGQYRRIQLGRHLIDGDVLTLDDIEFDDSGKIVRFGVLDGRLDEIIESGHPFVTSGCPGENGEMACNRPYANSVPGPDVRNFPFVPKPGDIERIKEQLWT